MSSSMEVRGRLPSKVSFRQKSYSIEGCLPSKDVFSISYIAFMWLVGGWFVGWCAFEVSYLFSLGIGTKQSANLPY